MKSFNSRFINSWKELQHSKVGIEFEFYSNFSFIKTLEVLNNTFSPIEIWAFNQYHSDFDVTDKKFKIEPDYSGGSNMIELITGPLNWIDARVIIIKMLEFIKTNGYTDEHCSIHINISFDDMNVIAINPLKLILNFNEDFVYEKFPTRRNNIYAKSIKWIVPFEDWNDSETAINSIIQSVKLPDDTKYYGINLQKRFKNYLEFRYIGDENYENKTDDILNLMDYFIIQTRKAIGVELTDEDNIKLMAYLEQNINWFKQYKTYDEFLSNIHGINVEVDRSNLYNDVKMSWDKFKNKLFEIVKSCDNIKNAIINYNSTTGRLEIVDAIINKIHYLKGIDFINCQISECAIYNCDIIDCRIENGHMYNCNIYETKLINIKLSNCNALEWSELNDCMFDGGVLDCKMTGGVFRSGELRENADLESDVKMANKNTFWKINPIDKKIDGLEK
jgi:hypothetical protein